MNMAPGSAKAANESGFRHLLMKSSRVEPREYIQALVPMSVYQAWGRELFCLVVSNKDLM
ncbi:hypothetical protein SAMN05216191_105237 [Paenibacillus jilunlii]|uniref:Uncharacterized protein n=1 Tax=Paenibacillus jilunlii TaxID=682956 RepID=A0A1G9MQ50_9BACL|nr:hypothetical protein AML91_25230 [Paenibacillus jilunlii]SDL76027.1 hypothetical protein SAMN05216191_105237 [Paenibacillus jilunlii]